jgi:predicted secreted protein
MKCEKQDIINIFQRYSWTLKPKSERTFIVIMNCFAILPGIIYFLNNVYGQKIDDWSILFLITFHVLIPLISFGNQLRQGLTMAFKLSKTTFICLLISSLFYILSFSEDFKKLFRKTFPNRQVGTGVSLMFSTTILFLYVVGFSEVNYSRKMQYSDKKCLSDAKKMI